MISVGAASACSVVYRPLNIVIYHLDRLYVTESVIHSISSL